MRNSSLVRSRGCLENEVEALREFKRRVINCEQEAGCGVISDCNQKDVRMNVKLLPCPFCGGDPCISTSDDGMARWVECPSCECDGPPIDYRFTGTHEEALRIVVDSWNRRTSE
jgi:hypothetical protein